MRKLLIATLILSFSVCAFAADFTKINKKTIKTFFEIMPKYKAIAMKYADENTMGNVANVAKNSKMYKELSSMLGKYNVSMEDFGTFMKKITIAFSTAQMQASGMPSMPFNLGMKVDISDGEMNIVKKYLNQIEEVMSRE